MLRFNTGSRAAAILSAVAVVVALAPVGAGAAGGASRTYTFDADFDEGSAINVEHSTADQLQLDDTVTPFGFIWVAVSTKGTIVKIDTDTGQVLGEFFTSPAGQPKDPSRTTVDNDGNVWATNRAGNSVVHVGLEENGGCVDRNGNGTIDTSTGLGNIRPWTNAGGANTAGGVSTAQDECIIHYTRVNSFGTRHVSVNKNNDLWVSGTGGQRFDLIDGDTGAIIRSEPSVGFGGYGGLIDGNDVIWSANRLLRWNTANPLTGPNGINWRGYFHDSYGLCIDPSGNVWNTSLSGNQIRKFAPDGTLLGTFGHGFQHAQGCVAGPTGDIWVAHSIIGGGSTVGHLLNDGTFVGNVPVQDGPTGVAVDRLGKVWATNYYSGTVSRIDPNLGPIAGGGVHVGVVDLTTTNLGGNLYNYSDMTGSTLHGAPDVGSWTTVFDSGLAGAEWGKVLATLETPSDSAITITAASSADGVTFSAPQPVGLGTDMSVPNGRYLKVNVAFERATTGESPVLFDLTVRTANEGPVAEAGGAYSVFEGDSVVLDGSGSTDADGDALSYAWDLDGDGVFETSGAMPTFSAAGLDGPSTRTVALRVCDPSDACAGDEATIEINNAPPIADAGADLTVFRNEVFDLSGTWTDPAEDLDSPYAWAWNVPADPTSGTENYGTPVDRTGSFALEGSYTLGFDVTDKDGGTGSDSLTVTVLNRAPDCGDAAASKDSLWAPDHKLVDIQVQGVTDAEGDALTLTITGIRQDEAVNGLGDGNRAPDGFGVGTDTARVRAERSGNRNVPGDGRVYHIAFEADDGHGGSCSGVVLVEVPHDQRGDAAVDQGPLFDSTVQ